MPVNVPTEPKKYTTVYENFKGVDFTNDASNVYKRRSPDGKNMLPDLDGRPYKRKGWKVEYSAQDFIDAAGSSATTVTPKRIHHFSLGGKEYLMLFNSLGVFYTAEDMNTVVKCQLAKTVNGTTTYSAFPPPIDGISLEADSGRTFFFESGGVAGLYTFVGTALFRFDGQYYWEVEPYVPRVLVACDSDGTGTMFEGINLLTTRRTVSYQCNGTNRIFAVPGGINTSKGYVVEKLNYAGEWEEATSGFSYSNGLLTFTTAPPETITGEDCMRVTYDSANIATYVVSKTVTSTAYQYERWWTYDERWYSKPVRAGNVPSKYGQSGWDDTSTFSYSDATFTLVNPKNANDTSVTPVGGTKTVNAYGNTVTYRPPLSSFNYDVGAWDVEVVKKSTVKVYYSTDYNTLYNAVQTNNYSSVYYAGTYGSNYAAEGWEEFHRSVDTGFVTFTNAHQAKYSTQYYYAFTFMQDQYNRKDRPVECTLTYDQFQYVTTGADDEMVSARTALSTCQRATVYGSGLINQVFLGASTSNGYNSRLWYSGVGRPEYFPDLNYVEVGSNDTRIMGMIKCDEYLGVVKAGNALDSSIYLAYPTSFDEETTYAVKQSIAGVGALSTGAFNILSDESIFLSPEGIMAIEFGGENRLRNRSFFVDKRLCAEQNLADAVSYVFRNMYYLSINNRCYVLDGAQKNSWVNEKTNLQYECYFLDNVPAQCFGDMGGKLWFTDYEGNLCRFKDDSDPSQYRDEYMVGHLTVNADDVTGSATSSSLIVDLGDLTYNGHAYTKDELPDGTVVHFATSGNEFSVTRVTDTYIELDKGVPIDAVWDTIADDDGAIHFFKNLNKKGFVVSLLPGSSSGVTVSLKPDEKEPIKYGTTDANGNVLPFDYFVRKKVKKYKRLQIICENNALDQSFGIDQILKTYTLGNYSKNRK